MGVFRSPVEEGKRRRVDIKFYPYRQKAFTKLYFTGSGTFNRSMRLWATKSCSMTLNDHGLYKLNVSSHSEYYRMKRADKQRSRSKWIDCKNEREIFDALNHEYREPCEWICFDSVVEKGASKRIALGELSGKDIERECRHRAAQRRISLARFLDGRTVKSMISWNSDQWGPARLTGHAWQADIRLTEIRRLVCSPCIMVASQDNHCFTGALDGLILVWKALFFSLSRLVYVVDSASQTAGKTIDESTSLDKYETKIHLASNIAVLIASVHDLQRNIEHCFDGVDPNRLAALYSEANKLGGKEFLERKKEYIERMGQRFANAPPGESASSPGAGTTESGGIDTASMSQLLHTFALDSGSPQASGSAPAGPFRQEGEPTNDLHNELIQSSEDEGSGGEGSDKEGRSDRDPCQKDPPGGSGLQGINHPDAPTAAPARSPSSLLCRPIYAATAEDIQVLTLPSTAAATNRAYRRKYSIALDEWVCEGKNFLFVGKCDIHSEVLICMVDIVFRDRTANDLLVLGKLFGLLLQDNMSVIKEAKQIVRHRMKGNLNQKCVYADPTKPLSETLWRLNSDHKKMSGATPTSDLAEAAKLAFDEANIGRDWVGGSLLTEASKDTSAVIGELVVLFRFYGMVTYADMLQRCPGKNEQASLKELLSLGQEICNEDITQRTVLWMYEFVLVPGVHDDSVLHRTFAAVEFLCVELPKKKWAKEWAIAEYVPLTQTMEEAGGKEAVLARMMSAVSLRPYLGAETGSGLNKRKRASRTGTFPLVGHRVMFLGACPRGVTYSLLCSPGTRFLADYGKTFLQKDVWKGLELDEDLQADFKTTRKNIVSYREKANYERPHYMNKNSPTVSLEVLDSFFRVLGPQS